MPQLLPPGWRLEGALRCPGEWGWCGRGSPIHASVGPGRLVSAAGAPEPLPLARLRVCGRGGYWPRTPPTLPRGWQRWKGTLQGTDPIRVGKACAVYHPRRPRAFQGNVGVCWELSILTASVLVTSITARPSTGPRDPAYPPLFSSNLAWSQRMKASPQLLEATLAT